MAENEVKDNIEIEKINTIQKEEENKETPKPNNENDIDNDNDIVIKGETLSKSRINITFSDINDSNVSHETFKTYKSKSFQAGNLDLDLPNFSPPKYKKSNWKMMHSCNSFFFSLLYGISVGFMEKKTNTYYNLVGFSYAFLFLSSLVEWTYFKRGCIGESNLNSKLKRNIDKSWKAKILRSEYGIKYFISLMASFILLTGSIIHYIAEELNFDLNDNEINFTYFNLFGMMTLALSQILKLDKILNIDNKISYVKTDFSKTLFEILFFFASLLEGGAYMMELIYHHINESPFYIVHLIIKIVNGILFFVSAIILQFNYFFSEYCKLSSREYRRF